MTQATGCVSVGSTSGDILHVERIIECVSIDPGAKLCVINVDVCLHNDTAREQSALIIHRGSLIGRNATAEAWDHKSELRRTWAASLSERLRELHQPFDPIGPGPDGTVRIGALDYTLWHGSLRPIVGQKEHVDVPFTMWEIGPLPAGQRTLTRLEVQLTAQSFERQIGKKSEFYAYGDAVLLDVIRREDLPFYSEPDVTAYETALDSFCAHVVPDVFEWLLVSPENMVSPWSTSPLTYNLTHRMITGRYESSTHWYVADYASSNEYRRKGKSANAFVLKIEANRTPATQSELVSVEVGF